jgi:hypothetical protein
MFRKICAYQESNTNSGVSQAVDYCLNYSDRQSRKKGGGSSGTKNKHKIVEGNPTE